MNQEPGSASLPFFGVQPAIVDDKGNELGGVCSGSLVLKRPTPSMMSPTSNNRTPMHPRVSGVGVDPSAGLHVNAEHANSLASG